KPPVNPRSALRRRQSSWGRGNYGVDKAGAAVLQCKVRCTTLDSHRATCPASRGPPAAERVSVDPVSAMSKDSLPLFLQACGATRPLRLHVERHGRSGPPRYEFARPFLLIGRAPDTDVQLDDAAVSRRHAYLQVLGGRVFCTDLHSRTGLRFNGKPERSGWLGGRPTLSIGP